MAERDEPQPGGLAADAVEKLWDIAPDLWRALGYNDLDDLSRGLLEERASGVIDPVAVAAALSRVEALSDRLGGPLRDALSRAMRRGVTSTGGDILPNEPWGGRDRDTEVAPTRPPRRLRLPSGAEARQLRSPDEGFSTAERVRRERARARGDRLAQFGEDPRRLGVLPEVARREVAGQDEGSRRPFIGVPADYVAEREVSARSLGPGSADTLERRAESRVVTRDAQGNILTDERGGPRLGGGTGVAGNVDFIPAAPLYREGDEMIPAGWSRERRGRLQAQLVRAGLLDPDDVIWGAWDGATMQRYADLLAYANVTGTTNLAALSELSTLQDEQLNRQIAQLRRQETAAADVEAYRPPDPAAVAEEIRETFRSALGRRPTSAELATWSEQLASGYRAEYEADRAERVAAIQAEIDATIAASDPRLSIPEEFGGEPAPVTPAAVPAGVGAATGPARVDPVARFAEEFTRQMAPEMQVRSNIAAGERIQESVHGIGSSLIRRFRGGL